jgi:hypothetical protein
MSYSTRTAFWRELAHEVEETKEHPGYRYKYFKSFTELDEYMCANVDPNWKDTSWGKFLLRAEDIESEHTSLSAVDQTDVQPIAPGNSFTANKNDYECLARDLIRAGVTDLETLMGLIGQTTVQYREYTGPTTHTYRPVKAVVQRYITKYNTKAQRPLKQTPKHIVTALIKFYADQRLSLRDIAYKLNKNDGIKLSYERIRELIAEDDHTTGRDEGSAV